MHNDEFDTVTLYLDNGETLECDVLCILNADGREYAALLPREEKDGEDEALVYLYRFLAPEGEEPVLESIEDDREYEAACDAYEDWLDTLECGELELDGLELDALDSDALE